MGLTGKVDNPDQRISDDLGSFVEATQTFTIKLVFAIAVSLHISRFYGRSHLR
jgi:ABC-type uncharacterized transport system fused permease/ATPase subunit